MAHQWADRVAETSTTTGTGALTLAGAVTGFQRFSAVCSVNDTVIYAIEAVDGSGVPTGDWEVGVGTYSALNTLTRTTVIKSSNSNAAVSFAAGTKNVFLDDIASTRNTLQQYSGISEPSTPVEGLIFWAQDRNNWAVAMQKGVSGTSVPVNPLVPGRTGLAAILPQDNGATVNGIGVGTSTANPSAIASDAASAFNSFMLTGANTTATVSTVGTIRSSTPVVYWRSSQANGGFHVSMVCGLSAVGNTNCRWFCGLTNSSTALAATFDPAATTNSLIGLGATGTDTVNAKLYYATGSAVGSVDLGTDFPAKTVKGGVFCLDLVWLGGSATTVAYRVKRLDDLTKAAVTGTVAVASLPPSAAHYAHWHINNNATAAASVLACGAGYFERGF